MSQFWITSKESRFLLALDLTILGNSTKDKTRTTSRVVHFNLKQIQMSEKLGLEQKMFQLKQCNVIEKCFLCCFIEFGRLYSTLVKNAA